MAQTFNLSKAVYVKDRVANVDALYGPYASPEEACSAIPYSRRTRGLTVGILTESDCVEYQWKAGINDIDLVIKMSQESPRLSYTNEYPENQTIHVSLGGKIRIGFRFTSPNYGQCQITIKKDGETVKIFKSDKGYIDADLGNADIEGTFTYTVTGIDALSIPAEEVLIYKVVVGGVKISCDFPDRLVDGVNTSTNLETIFNASVADTSKTIKVKGEVKNTQGQIVGNELYVEGQDPSYSISGGMWNIGVISTWGTYTLTLWAYTGDSPEDTDGDDMSSFVSYSFELLNEDDFILTSSVAEVSSNTNSAVSVPFKIESGTPATLKANGLLYNAVYSSGQWQSTGDPISGYELNRDVFTGITNYWNLGKIANEGDYMIVMWATTIGGDPAPISHENVKIYAHIDRYQSDYSIVSDGLIAQFTANGKSNNNDKDTDGTWKNDVKGTNIFFELHGLNYNTNGWKHVDPSIPESEDGETMLSFTGESYGVLKNGNDNYNPMSLIRSYSGFTSEIIFRSRCIGELNAKVMTSHYGFNTNSAGYSAAYDTVTIGSDSAQIKYNVSEDDWIHATLVIDKTTHTDNITDIQDYAPKPLVTVYINGSMCTSIILTEQMTFNNIQPLVLLNAAFNPSGNNIDFFGQCEIKAIRFYNRALLAHEVVKNYIASFYTEAEKEAVDGRNGDVLPTIKFININDTEPKTEFENKNAQLISFDELNKITVKSLQKIRYVHAKILYQEPGKELITWDHCIVQTQGTSSLAYPVKNYKITLYKDSTYNKKLKTEAFDYLGWNPENKFTLKCDYMEAAHLNNTPSCIFYNNMIDKMSDPSLETQISSLINNGWTGVPFEEGSTYDWTKDKRTPSRRGDYVEINKQNVWRSSFDAIKGFPCIINYFESQTEFDQGGSGVYVGTYMFNLDKSAASLGFSYGARKDTNGKDTINITNYRSDSNLYDSYDSSKTYNEGDKVSYEGVSYIAVDDDITGGWNPDNWEAIPSTVKNMMQSFEGVANKSNSAGCFYSFEDYKKTAYHDDYCQTAYIKFLEEHPSSELTLDEFISEYAGSSTPYAHDSQGNPLYLVKEEDYEIPYANEYEYFAADYEARYDYDDLEEGGAEFWGTSEWGLKRMIDWVSSASADGTRFRNEFSNYFDLEYCIIYYLQMIVFGQVDNAGKNSMWDTWDGLIWRPRPYDLDTATGLDNSGFEAIGTDAELIRSLSPFIDDVKVGVGGYSEDVSPLANSRYAAYNTRTSKFWNAFASVFAAEIANMYGKLRDSKIYSLDYICQEYLGNTSDIIGESYYNRDMTTKFYRLSDIETYITRMHGNRVEKFKYWMSQRLVFCDTLYNYYNDTDSLNGNIVLRSDAFTSGAPVSVYLSIQTYSPQYVKVDVGSTRDAVLESYCSPDSEYEDPNRPGTTAPGLLFRLPLVSGNKEIQISGAGNIRVIGNLAGLKASSLDLGAATKLTNLDLSGSTKLVALSLNNNKYLQYLNCEDDVQLGTDASGAQLDLSNCTNLKEVNVNRTKLTSISFPIGGSLKKVYARNTTITGITLDSCQFLDTIDVTGCENILSYNVINCPSILYINTDGLPIVSFNINNCKNVSELSLAGCNSITSLNIANCPSITSLNFRNNQSLAITVLNLAAIKGLTNLDVSGSGSIRTVILPASVGAEFTTFNMAGSSIKNICYDVLSENGADMSRLIGLTTLSFSGCSRIEHIFGLNYKGNCNSLFYNCSSLIDVAGTIETTGGSSSIFNSCGKLNNISGTIFRFSECVSLDSAFAYCYALPLSEIKHVFDSCGTKLKSINSICYAKSHSDYTSAAYTTMPTNFFGNLKSVENASTAFWSSGIGDIPYGAFVDRNGNYGLISLTNGNLMFGSNGRITTMPTDILKYMPALVNAQRMFGDNSNLNITIPSNFFAYAPNITTIRAIFNNNSKMVVHMGDMSDLLTPLTKLTDCGFMFNGCSKVDGDVPTGFFANNSLLTNAACCFRYTGITGLPVAGDSLLRIAGDNSSVHSMTDASGMFCGCTGLSGTIVPSSLFAGGDNITSIGNNGESMPGSSNTSSLGIFEGCSGITRFGEDFFNMMPKLVNIARSFYGCSNLIGCPGTTTFPGSILSSHTRINDATGLFYGCSSLVVPSMPNLFEGSKGTMLYVDNLFRGCSNISGFNNDLLSNMPRLRSASGVFRDCTSMIIDASELDILNGDSSISNTSAMFYNCTGLSGTIPASLFNSCRNTITDVSYMFYNCMDTTGQGDGIRGIGIGTEDSVTTNPQLGLLAECLKLTTTAHMFDNCYFLVGRIPWDLFWTSNIEKEYTTLEDISYMFYESGFNQPTESDGTNYMFHPDLFAKTSRLKNMSFVFGKSWGRDTSNVYPNWNNAYPVHPQAFLNMYNVTNIQGLFKKCRGLGGSVSNQWFSNCITTITNAQEAFAQTKLTGVASDFLCNNDARKNTRLTYVGKIFYGCSLITSNLPPLWNVNAFTKIDYSNTDAGFGGGVYACSSAPNYNDFINSRTDWGKAYSY